MINRIPEDQIPNDEPWTDREFLEWAIHERGLSARTIAFELETEASRVRVYAERLGVVRPWRHEPTLRRLYVERGLSADEIAALEQFNCTATTVRKYLTRYEISETNSENINYGRLDKISLGSDDSGCRE